jgi:uncharacterized membrane protein
MNKLKQILSDLRASLWFVPGVMIIFSIALALALIEADSQFKAEWLAEYPRLFGLGADGSRGMLTAIASSMLTVAALAFSLTLSAVSQASAQFTPRIFRNFMRDRANQFVLGYFVSVFAFCLLVLRTIRGGDEIKFVPSFAVLTGLALAVGGVLVLIFFIHHIADSLQITTILAKITLDTEAALEKMFPEELRDRATDGGKAVAWRAEDVRGWKRVYATEAGYIQNVDTDGLLDFASENKILIRMRRGTGQFAGRGTALAEIAPRAGTSNGKITLEEKLIERVGNFFNLARYRTIEQDVGFGIRQIVDIALKALSPGVNDTTTAIGCIDNLGEIVGEIARRQMTLLVRAEGDEPRLLVAAPDFREYVETAFDQIRISGKGNFAIFERLIETLVLIAERTNDTTRRRILGKQIELTGEYSEQTLQTAYEKEKVRLKLREADKILHR